MKKEMAQRYVCPVTRHPLELSIEEEQNSNVVKGAFRSGERQYPIENGIPDFASGFGLTDAESRAKAEYDRTAEEFYDNAVDWLFQSFYEDEERVREGMIDRLELREDSRVLEIGCGTGRDSFRIARRLGNRGALFLQDLSPNMVLKTRERLSTAKGAKNGPVELHYFISRAVQLPFPDGYFDALFHFGGFNVFPDQRKTLEEFNRIVKQGGKVVFGDEALPPWLEGTAFGDIVCTNNPLFRHKIPLSSLPVGAREVTIRWILGNCFYLVDYRVAEGTPPIHLDLPHQGRRGGTMRTRYYGQLEGVTEEAKKLVQEAAAQKGWSVHRWLDAAVREVATRDLGLGEGRLATGATPPAKRTGEGGGASTRKPG